MSSLTTFRAAEDSDGLVLVSLEEERLLDDNRGPDPAPLRPSMLRRPETGRWPILVDATGLSSAMLLVAVITGAVSGGRDAGAVAIRELWLLLPCLPVLVASLSRSRHRLSRSVTTTTAQQLHETAAPLAAATLLCLGAWRVIGTLVQPPAVSETGLLWTALSATLLVSLARIACRASVRLQAGSYRRVLIVGSGAVAERLATQLEATGQVRIVGFVDDEPKDPTGCLGPLDHLADVCVRESVDHLVVAFSRSQAEDIVEALRPVQGVLPISVIPRLFDVLPASADAHGLVSGYPVVSVAPSSAGRGPRAAKRSMDIAGALLALIVALPMFVAAAVGVRLTSRGPVFLRQIRVGRDGREFTIWKFRTFTVTESVPPPEVLECGEVVTGPFPKLKYDPRMTRFGRVLRRFSIDEFPQVVNVIWGNMSLVGPRPLAPDYAWNFDTWALRRYDVKPGVTGLWQISGRNDLTYEEMCRLDNLYVTCWSLGFDVRILLQTARAVLGGKGCY